MSIHVYRFIFCLLGALWTASTLAADDPQETKEMSGMSILGNSEAPKSLVIVPWKTSEIGDGIGVKNMLDGRALPVDKDVFARELDYHELTRGTSQDASAEGAPSLANIEESR